VEKTRFEKPEVDVVILRKSDNLKIGKFVKVKIVDYCDYDLLAEMLQARV